MRSILMKLCGVFEAELLVYYKHRKFVSRAYEKTGHFASREGISRDAGVTWAEIRDVPGNTGLLATLRLGRLAALA